MSCQDLLPIAEAILAHHEWWDGTGYPQGLRGDAIPLGSRIVAIIDAYDVMTTGRVYKKPLSAAGAIQELRRCAGTQFDPKLVEMFVEMLSRPEVEAQVGVSKDGAEKGAGAPSLEAVGAASSVAGDKGDNGEVEWKLSGPTILLGAATVD
jgi:HD-GYP domain-containing protein (c-di-GMP phosphodiesterase class II)